MDVPPSWGADKNGVATTNPDDILTTGGLFPLGGPEESSGYKVIIIFIIVLRH
jgi:LDH2 family malate/lactate/ureidoglycolate dehydrogenase